MHDSTETRTPSQDVAVNPQVAFERVEEARQLYQRTLAKWAGDMLVLRSQSLEGPRWPDLVDPVLLRKVA